MDPRGQGQCRLQDCERDMGLVDDPESGWLEEIGEQFYKVAQLVVEEVHLLTVFWKSVRPPPPGCRAATVYVPVLCNSQSNLQN